LPSKVAQNAAIGESAADAFGREASTHLPPSAGWTLALLHTHSGDCCSKYVLKASPLFGVAVKRKTKRRGKKTRWRHIVRHVSRAVARTVSKQVGVGDGSGDEASAAPASAWWVAGWLVRAEDASRTVSAASTATQNAVIPRTMKMSSLLACAY
jgi:hypothetical protein